MKSKQETLTKQRILVGIFLMVLSSASFSAMQLMIRYSNVDGTFPLMEQVFFRNLGSFIGAWIVLRKKGKFPLGSRKIQPYLMGRSVAGVLGIITFFYATNHARIADANILNKLSPFVVTVLSAVFLGEKVRKVQYAALLISFAGAWIVCGPTLDSAPLPVLAALGSAVFSGIAYTFVAALKDKADPLVIVMHFSTLSVVCAALCMMPDFVVPTASQLLCLLLISVFGSLGQGALTYAYRFAPASEVSIYNYSGIIWSALLGWIFLGERVSAATVLGGAMVAGSSLLAFICGKRRRQRELQSGD